MRSTHALAGWLFAAPALTVIVVFFGLPVLAAFALSLTDFDIYALADIGNLHFAGFPAEVQMGDVMHFHGVTRAALNPDDPIATSMAGIMDAIRDRLQSEYDFDAAYKDTL